jgi:predicted ATPase
MLKTLDLTNFKCFASQRFELAPVTILAGQNGMGKSTVLQSLLLIRQSEDMTDFIARSPSDHERQQSPPYFNGNPSLNLNGRYVACGTARDVLYERASADLVQMGLSWDEDASCNLRFDAGLSDRDTMLLEHLTLNGLPGPPLVGAMPYLAAERKGPRMSHAVSAHFVDELEEVGHDGAYAVAFLESHRSYIVETKLRHRDAPDQTLAEQVSAWMAEISPGIRFHTQFVPEVNAAALAITFAAGRAISGRFRPTGVGFGISYTLPVVVTLLAARPGSIVLVENPEAHLHPRGQMAIGDLIARAGAAGIQVIVETHSDHIVNGVRLAVKELRIAAEKVRFHYFTRKDDGDRLVHEVESPTINADGRLDHWPEGFFDQWDLALERLL